MRTGIFVNSATSVAIDASEPDLKLTLMVMVKSGAGEAVEAKDVATLNKSTKVALAPGIYRVFSTQPITVTGSGFELQLQLQDKDPWPDPRPNVVAFFDASSRSFGEI
jgi:hypothetical protein